MRVVLALACLATVLTAVPARAQFGEFLDRATQKAQEAVDRASQQPATPPPEERAAPADDGDEPTHGLQSVGVLLQHVLLDYTICGCNRGTTGITAWVTPMASEYHTS